MSQQYAVDAGKKRIASQADTYASLGIQPARKGSSSQLGMMQQAVQNLPSAQNIGVGPAPENSTDPVRPAVNFDPALLESRERAQGQAGLLSQGESFSIPTFSPANAMVNVSAPEQRKYAGFDLDKGYDERASDFRLSDDAMVRDQLESLLSSNSDYMKRAVGKANTVANRRGLLSSSMAAGAGTAAAIDAALPIAQQDAASTAQSDLSRQGYFQDTAGREQQAFNTSRLSAQDATQRSGELQQQFQNQVGINNQTAQQQAILSAQDASEAASMAQLGFQHQKTLQQMDEGTRKELLDMQNKNNFLLQQSQAESNRFQDLAQQMVAIQTNEKLSPEAKDAAINNLKNLAGNSLNSQKALMEAAGIEGFSAGGGATSPGGAGEAGSAQQFVPSSVDLSNFQKIVERGNARLAELNERLAAGRALQGFGGGGTGDRIVGQTTAEINALKEKLARLREDWGRIQTEDEMRGVFTTDYGI